MRRRKKKMSEAWWDAHITIKGIGALTWLLAADGDEKSRGRIQRYFEAKVRHEARQKNKTKSS